MTIFYAILAIIAAIALIAQFLPRKIVVTRQAEVAMRPEDVIVRVTHLFHLGAMVKPVRTIEAKVEGNGARVTWTVISDMGFNPIFRIFGLFMDSLLGKTNELGLKNIAA